MPRNVTVTVVPSSDGQVDFEYSSQVPPAVQRNAEEQIRKEVDLNSINVKLTLGRVLVKNGEVWNTNYLPEIKREFCL